jgi:hypothetical protein
MDGDEFTRWLTYAELAEARGISKASATRMAFRRRWRRQVGNDGVARVAVPIGQDTPQEAPNRDTRPANQDGSMDGARVMEAAIASLTEARNQAEARADREQSRADQERSRGDLLQNRLEGMQGELQQARHEVEALQRADATRKAGSRLARAWRAWRGD